MNAAKVGIEFLLDDSKFRRDVTGVVDFLRVQLGEALKQNPVEFPMPKPIPLPKPDTSDQLTAIDAISRAEKKMNELRARYSQDASQEIIADIKRLQDQKAVILHAMTEDVDQETRKELQIKKKAIDDELRLMKQVALDKPEVAKGGAGGRVGLLGTGRQNLGGLATNVAQDLTGNLAASAGPLGGVVSQLGAIGPAGIAAGAGIGATVFAIKKAIDVGTEFQTTMADLQAITGLSAAAVAKIGDNAKKAGTEFGLSATEVVGSTKLLISALGPDIAKDASAIDLLTRNTLTLAKASGEDANTAARALTTTMGQFGYNTLSAAEQAAQSSRIINILGAAAQKGNAEVGDLADGMKVVGTVASQSKISVEQTAAALEVLAANEIKGAEGGTGLRNVILKMSAGTKEGEAALNQMGLTFQDINPEKVGLSQGLQTLKTAFEQVKDPVERAAYAKKLFGLENVAAANAMMQNVPMLNQMTKDVTGTSTAYEQSAIKQATFAESTKRFMSMMENIGISLFQALQPVLESAMQVAQDLAPVLSVLGEILGAVLPPAIDILMAPLKLLIGAVKGLIEYGKGLSDRWATFADQMKTILAPVINLVSKAWDSLKAAMKPVGDYLSGVWNAIIGKVTDGFSTGKQAVLGVVNAYIDLQKWLFEGVKAVGMFIAKFLGIGDAAKKVVGWLGDTLGAIKDTVGAVTDFLGITDSDKKVRVTASSSGNGATTRKFADGGVVTRPQKFRYGRDGEYAGERGEAGDEAIIPLSKYPGLRALMEGKASSSSSDGSSPAGSPDDRADELANARQERRLTEEKSLENRRLQLMEEGYEKRMALENERHAEELEKAQGNAEALEIIEAEHEKKIKEIQAASVKERESTVQNYFEKGRQYLALDGEGRKKMIFDMLAGELQQLLVHKIA